MQEHNDINDWDVILSSYGANKRFFVVAIKAHEQKFLYVGESESSARKTIENFTIQLKDKISNESSA